jgi:hypothetical protein
MNTALIYIAVSISLSLLLSLLGRIPDHARGNPDVYTYPKKTVWTVFAGIPFLVLVSGFIFFAGTPPKSQRGAVIVVAIWVTVILLYTCAYIYVRQLSIQIERDEIRVRGFLIHRTVFLSAARRYVAIQGGNGGRLLQIYDADNRCMFKVTDTIQDFDGLTAQIRHLLPKHDVSYESRDKWGKWTRKVSR